MFSVFSAVKVNQMKPTMQGTLLATILVFAHVPKYVLLFIFNPVVQDDNKRMYPRTRLQLNQSCQWFTMENLAFFARGPLVLRVAFLKYPNLLLQEGLIQGVP